MEQSLKLGIRAWHPTRLNVKRGLFSAGMLWLAFSLVGCTLPVISLPGASAQPELPEVELTLRATLPESSAILIPTAGKPTLEPTATPLPTRMPPFLYATQPGDSLVTLAARFNVKPADISSPDPLPAEGLLKPGLMLTIPRNLPQTSPNTRVIPDSEVVYSPTSLDFAIKTYVKDAGGYLSTGYSEYVYNATHTGAEVVQIVAQENSFNPRLLLALLQYQANWVTGQPGNMAQSEYPLGNLDVNYRGLYKQLSWTIRQLSIGYYGWRTGKITSLTFKDQTSLRLSPELNAGTVAVAYFFAKFYDQREWARVLYSNDSFPALYEKMFGSPWVRTQPIEPFFPANMTQPKLELPFYFDRIWSFTGGPHDAWGPDSALAAIDFAPGSTESGCIPSQEWVIAPAPGLVLRSDNGVVVLDLDGDGYEQTGWVLMFLHIGSEKRVAAGTRLNLNDPIGHPSCEGGIATGTHFHFARKYNGEWILADGALPFVIGGWRAHAGAKEYDGTLTKDGKTITACTCGSADTKISRPKTTP